MRCRVWFFFFFFFLATGKTIVGQDRLTGTLTGRKDFAVNDVLCESSRTCNSFLKVISRSSGFPIDEAAYSIFYTFSYQSDAPGMTHISLHLDSIGGTTVFRGFDLGSYLIPSSIELEWLYVDESGMKILGGHRELFCKQNRNFEFTAVIPDAITPVSIEISTIQFIYREQDFVAFDSLSRRIQHYYAASETSEIILAAIWNIPTTECSNLPFAFLAYFDYLRVYSCILNEEFDRQLPLNQLDPADFSGDKRRLSGRLTGFKLDIDDQYRKWKKLIPELPPAVFAKAVYEQINSWFLLAETVEYPYQDFFYSLGKLSGSTASGAGLTDSLDFLFSGNEAYRREFCEVTAEYFLEAAVMALKNENFTHAITLCDNAALFYASRRQDSLVKQAWSGLYNAYLLIARRTLTIGNYEFAEQYLNEAHALYLRANGLIPSDEAVFILFSHLFQDLYDQGARSMAKPAPREALFFFREAFRIDSAYCRGVHSLQVQQKLNQLQYDVYYSYLDEATDHLRANQLAEALDFYQKALAYREEKGMMNHDALLDSLHHKIEFGEYTNRLTQAIEREAVDKKQAMVWLEQAAWYYKSYVTGIDTLWNHAVEALVVPEILDALSRCRVLVWGGKMEQAQMVMNDIFRRMEFYDLVQHNALYVQYTALEKKIEAHACHQLESLYRKTIFSVQEAIRRHDYADAATQLYQLPMPQLANCEMDCSDADSLRKRYTLHFSYFLWVDTCRTALIYHDAEQAAASYASALPLAEALYISDETFRPVHLDALLTLYKRDDMAIDLARSLKTAAPEVACRLLRFNATQGKDRLLPDKRLLHDLGILLAKRDIENLRTTHPGAYSGNMKALSPIENAYNLTVKANTNRFYAFLARLFF